MYSIEGKIGQGAFGSVFLANSPQGKVAIKQIANEHLNFEAKAMGKLSHPNIIKLLGCVEDFNSVNLILEWCNGGDLADFITHHANLSMTLNEEWCGQLILQALTGLNHLHQNHWFHRDLKPANLLLHYNNNVTTLKIADFGLVRSHPCPRPFTGYISTRWYRAPELLLRAPTYDPSVDVWALACITAELLNLQPLFPGTGELNQLNLISTALDNPSEEGWGGLWIEGVEMGRRINYTFPPTIPSQDLIPFRTQLAHSFIQDCLRWDPTKRSTAEHLLLHAWFAPNESIHEFQRDMTMKYKTDSSPSHASHLSQFSTSPIPFSFPKSTSPIRKFGNLQVFTPRVPRSTTKYFPYQKRHL
jgi:protein kinase